MKVKVKSPIQGDLVEIVCRNRGVDHRNLDRFLTPDESAIQSPLVYTNLQVASETIVEAIVNNKKIGFVVDSDLDGFCSSAMFINYIFQSFGYDNIVWFLHDEKEHGLTDNMMEKIDKSNVDVIILPDASSSDYEQHKILYEQGKVVIVIDHHEAERFSESAIVVNNQLDNFGNKTLCGAGMVMKVMEFIDSMYGFENAHNYMDLCATALVGDCMLMTHPETRFYVQKGLRNINNQLLFELYKAEADKNFEMVSFDIAPTINAFIRVGSEEEKLDLFNALLGFGYEREISIRGKGSVNLALPEYVSTLASRIKNRQTAEIKKAIDEKSQILGEDLPFGICILELDVNKNLTGLIGNRLVDKYNKPMIVVKNYGGVFRGSARTTETFHEFKSYLENLGYFTYCEGHQGAFGVGISEMSMNQLMKDLVGQSVGEDSELYLVDKSYEDVVSAYEIMSIDEFKNHWCRGFEKPLFHIKLNQIDSSNVDIIGQKRDTIRIKHNYITYVKFKCNEEEVEAVRNMNITGVEMIGSFAVNEWNDRLYPQVIVDRFEFKGEEIKKDEDKPFGFNMNGFGWNQMVKVLNYM